MSVKPPLTWRSVERGPRDREQFFHGAQEPAVLAGDDVLVELVDSDAERARTHAAFARQRLNGIGAHDIAVRDAIEDEFRVPSLREAAARGIGAQARRFVEHAPDLEALLLDEAGHHRIGRGLGRETLAAAVDVDQ